MSTHTEVVLVGGPFSGRVFTTPHEFRLFRVPEWPTPARVLRSSPEAVEEIGKEWPRIHEYRWFFRRISGPSLTIECSACVHDSIQDDNEILRCVVSAAITSVLVKGIGGPHDQPKAKASNK